jgi:hypothetical protein
MRGMSEESDSTHSEVQSICQPVSYPLLYIPLGDWPRAIYYVIYLTISQSVSYTTTHHLAAGLEFVRQLLVHGILHCHELGPVQRDVEVGRSGGRGGGRWEVTNGKWQIRNDK